MRVNVGPSYASGAPSITNGASTQIRTKSMESGESVSMELSPVIVSIFQPQFHVDVV